MKRICTVIAAIGFAAAAHAQNAGTVTNHAFAIGKGAGVTGYTSLLCASGQLAIGSATDPTCRTVSGDGTVSATGVFGLTNIPSGTPMAGTLLATAIAAPAAPAAGKLLIYDDTATNNLCAKNSATSVFCMVAPQAAVANQFATNLAVNGTLTTRQPVIADVSGFGTGVATALGVNVGTAGSVVVNGGALGTPSSGVGTNLTGVPISTGVSGLSAGCATALTTPSSANLRACFTDETGTGLIYFQGGDIGTPSAGVATNITALNATQLTTGAVPAARMPALTGDITSVAGTVATTLAAGSASNLNSGTLPAARIAFAAQSDQETATSTTLPVTPGRQQFHPSASKAWVNFSGSGVNGAQTVNASYNISGVSRTGSGAYTVSFTTAFSSANYACVGSASPGAQQPFLTFGAGAVGSITVQYFFVNAGVLNTTDPGVGHIICFGDQ